MNDRPTWPDSLDEVTRPSSPFRLQNRLVADELVRTQQQLKRLTFAIWTLTAFLSGTNVLWLLYALGIVMRR
jgi:hypothetical protein